MPRFRYGLPGKERLPAAQFSVIWSPRNTTRSSPGLGGANLRVLAAVASQAGPVDQEVRCAAMSAPARQRLRDAAASDQQRRRCTHGYFLIPKQYRLPSNVAM